MTSLRIGALTFTLIRFRNAYGKIDKRKRPNKNNILWGFILRYRVCVERNHIPPSPAPSPIARSMSSRVFEGPP